MRLPSDSELSKLMDTQASAMGDLCNIHQVSFASGTYGSQTEETRTTVSNVPCGIQFTGGGIVQRGQILLVDYDVILRLAPDVEVGMEDDITLIEKGSIVLSGTFKPFAHPTVSSTVQHVLLKRTE